MKKITGKVVSLVLALALVVTSFSGTFAMATTRSVTGTVTGTAEDDLYLCNGGTTTEAREVDLNAYLVTSDLKFTTQNHEDVDDPQVSSISHVSGDRLVSLKLSGDDDEDATLKLKSSSDYGTEVLSVQFKGDYTDDDGNEYTVKGTQTLTVHVYDAGQITFGKALGSDDSGTGIGVDDLDDLSTTAGQQVDLGFYNVQPGTSNAFAVYNYADKVFLNDGDDDGYKDSGYALEITSGDDDVQIAGINDGSTTGETTATDLSAPAVLTVGKHNAGTGTSIGAVTGDASTGNVTITAKKLEEDKKVSGVQYYKTSSDSDDKYTLKVKIAKKVDVGTLLTYNGTKTSTTGVTFADATGDNSFVKDSDYKAYTVEKSSGKTVLSDTYDYNNKEVTLTDKEVNFPAGTGSVSIDDDCNVKKVSGYVTTLNIADCNVGSVDLDGGDVVVDDGTVGDITTDGDGDTITGYLGTTENLTGNVTVSGSAKVGNIDTCDAADNEDLVTINGGTTGTISTDGQVILETSDDDDAINTGDISATDVSADAEEAKVTISSIKMTDDDSDITLYNSDDADLSINKIDLNYYDATLNLGDEDDEDNILTGTIPAPINATNGKIESQNEDTDVTLTGAVDVDTISLDSDTTVTFNGAVEVATVDGDGTLVVAPGKLYVTESASGARLKLSGTVATGTTAFTAAAGNVDTDDFDTYGYEVEKSTASGIDTFKVKSVTFAGIAINKTASSIAKGYSETFTAGGYPTGTSIPTGYTISWDFDGPSDVFTMTSTDKTATVKVNSIDASFASNNHGTLTATLYDEDGYELDDYDVAKCEITATATPAATSDTNSALSVAKGASYTMKVTSTTTPVVTTGSNGVFSVALVSKNGNAYLYKLTANGAVGSATGVYLNGTKIFVATVKAFAFTCDTSKDTTVKGAYTFKVTATATPTVSVGGTAFKLAFVSKTGNDYLYKITSAGKAGAAAGVYVNGTKAFVATVG